jgi:hypothetical protein
VTHRVVPTLRPVDADGTLVGYELTVGESEARERIGYMPLEDVVAQADRTEYMENWIDKSIEDYEHRVVLKK